MTPHTFHARGKNGIPRRVVFYETTRAKAAELAVAWGRKAGYSIEGTAS
jgi:hypothetical protein